MALASKLHDSCAAVYAWHGQNARTPRHTEGHTQQADVQLCTGECKHLGGTWRWWPRQARWDQAAQGCAADYAAHFWAESALLRVINVQVWNMTIGWSWHACLSVWALRHDWLAHLSSKLGRQNSSSQPEMLCCGLTWYQAA